MEIAEVFIACKKEAHYSRELILPQPALVHIVSGEMKIVTAERSHQFFAGDTVLLPRNQLGRMSKLPLEGQPCIAISVLFRRERLQHYYTANELHLKVRHSYGLKKFGEHPLLKSLFNSLQPYFGLAEALPADIAAFKVEEAIRVLRAIDCEADELLGYFEEPGKLDLVEFMEQNYKFNLPLEKFGYLTGRSLTTFKKDFKKTFNITPGKWLTQKRLELAHYQIFEQKKKPSEVYLDIGFEDLSHFSFAFKKHFGYNPTGLPSL
ncbi:AraC family transcriptional regulator [Mucilaginibacter sp. KACC 22773]|uniref:helix-turn-helix domain-containing protein n=1 Tax=Mucilaginibacter sp. KACC 22773 TaxID=3025671 RepID=UPI002365CA57|nr:AraC family transcriptional regulator [Mucilaginibacter sp. KACC 22773]WDF78690.1 AraC family transcriptional regulator [Mucilaginibacter sp. KACC 22773]